jgi:hypothetical protein
VIDNGITGIICDISAESITQNLMILIDDETLRKKLSSNLNSNNELNDGAMEIALREIF